MSADKVQILVQKHDPHPLTGGIYTVILPPRGGRTHPITFTVDDEELAALRDASIDELGGAVVEHV